MTFEERQVKILSLFYFMRTLIDIFNSEFQKIHERSLELIASVETDSLFRNLRCENGLSSQFSFGEQIIRSAAAVEQTFGGITVRLWDDPFEWTLPEELSSNLRIKDYVEEVAETRRKGFLFLKNDDALYRSIPAPSDLTPIAQLLLETIGRAENFLGQAVIIHALIAKK